MIELLAISYSPWSEKARWALDHHRVQYSEVQYAPLIGELALRKRLGNWRGRITIPILFNADGNISDSFAIARYAEDVGQGQVSLFPEGKGEDIQRWNQRSEDALFAGRALVTIRTMEDPVARAEAMPRMSPLLSKALRLPFTAFGAAYLRRKYKYSKSPAPHRAALAMELRRLRDELADGRPYLLGEHFSYADLAMATALQCVRPVTDEFIKLRPATRGVWTDEGFASEFAPLLDWRDRIYQEHR